MASAERRALITLAGKVDPSLAAAIKKADSQIKGLDKQSKSLGKSMGDRMKSAASSMGSALATGAKAAAAAAGAALVGVGGAALKSYASYEQMVGGVETLFGKSSGIVQQYAADAYKTAGVSANAYMEQATSFSASLIQSLGGDTNAAAQYADLAIRDMSDNANKMGTDIGTIQGTYQSLMRGNYAMLDNLKLGYGGTKSELERLVSDANDYKESMGEAGDLTADNFADVIQAINAVQRKLGITGTTAIEAEHTIEGSVNTMKAAWSNWLTGLGTKGADMGALTSQLVQSIGNVANNVGPVVARIGQSLAQALPEALAGAWNAAVGALGNMGIQLPAIDIGAITSVLTTVGAALQQVFSAVGPQLSNLASTVLPQIGNAIMQVFPLIASIASAVLPPLISMLTPLISILMQVVSAVLPPLTAAINALAPVIMQIVSAVLPPLASLLQQLMPVITMIATTVGGVLVAAVSALAPIIAAIVPAVQSVFSLAMNLLNSVLIPILSPLMQLVGALLPPLAGLISSLSGPISVVTGLFNGLVGAISSVVSWIGNLIGKIGEAASALANSPIGQFVGGAASFVGNALGLAKGGFTAGPTLAGEDPRYPTEAVISFNPAYRAKNRQYWAQAGHMLGMRVGGGSSGGTVTATSGATTIDMSGMTFAPKVEVRGNASKADIVAALRQAEAEFVDFVVEAMARREEASYA